MTTLNVKNGLARIWAVWAIKPGFAILAALCTTEEIAERYRSFVHENYPGSEFYTEEAPVDHVFGNADARSVAGRAALRSARRLRELSA